MVPKGVSPPGLLLPNGVNVGDSADTAAGQDSCRNAAEVWATGRMDEFEKHLSTTNASAHTIGTEHFAVDSAKSKTPPED